jgi:hypothetical protein
MATFLLKIFYTFYITLHTSPKMVKKRKNQNGNKKSPKVAKYFFFNLPSFNIGGVKPASFSKIHYIVKMVTKKW